MTNTLFLKQVIAQSIYSEQQLADQLGVSTATFIRKLDNIQEFKASEMDKISRILNLSHEQNAKVFLHAWINR